MYHVFPLLNKRGSAACLCFVHCSKLESNQVQDRLLLLCLLQRCAFFQTGTAASPMRCKVL